MVKPDRPPINNLNRLGRKVYNPIGFSRFYNFVLWFIFSGALFGFALARTGYMNYDGIFCGGDPGYGAAPGECWAYSQHEFYKVGIILHLVTIIPVSILVLIQFVPAIRHKFIIVHRINGYIVIVLTLATLAGAFMIARVSMNGYLETQLWVGVVGGAVIISYVLAYYNIKRLQIDQHRKWMMRAWFYMASIITQRVIFIIMRKIITDIGSYWVVMSCAKVVGIYGEFGAPPQAAQQLYPGCAPFFDGSNPQQNVPVHASMAGPGPENAAAALNTVFAPSLWLAVVMHAIGIEIYFRLTPQENERLRQVSYERQMERGLSHAGSSGLTSDRLGDSEPWVPQGKLSQPGGDVRPRPGVMANDQESPDSQHTLGAEYEERKESNQSNL